MSIYKTASEINQNKIEVAIRNINKRTIKPRDIQAEMNRRFDRMTSDNIGMHEELYPKYITAVKNYDRDLVF